MPEPENPSWHHCKITKLMREIIIVEAFFCKLTEKMHYRFALCEKLLILQGYGHEPSPEPESRGHAGFEKH